MVYLIKQQILEKEQSVPILYKAYWSIWGDTGEETTDDKLNKRNVVNNIIRTEF